MTRDAAWFPEFTEPRLVSQRYKSLDSIRGLAAFQVLISHAFLVNYAWGDIHHWYIRFTPLRFMLDARIAVVTFFVLSGFALFQMISRDDLQVWDYLVRRISRIYLPFAAAILLSAALASTVLQHRHAIEGVSDIAASNLREVSATSVLRHLLMIGTERDMQLDGPMWSLVQEMRISLAYPLLFFVMARLRTRIVVFTFFSISLLAFALLGTGPGGYYYRDDVAGNLVLTVFFIFPFVLGSCLAKEKAILVPLLTNRPVSFFFLFLVLIVSYWRLHLPAGVSDYLIASIAACVLLAALAYRPIIRILETKLLVELGTISYSLYLIHVPVLTITVFSLSEQTGLKAAVAAGVIISLVCSYIFNRAIEAPAHKLGRHLTRWGSP